jgi:uncharacterized membrane protein YgcG
MGDMRRSTLRGSLVGAGLLLAVVGDASLVLGKDLPPSQLGVNVYDFAEIWTDDTEARAESIVDGINARTQAQVAVVSWPSGEAYVSLGGAQVDARIIMDAWGVGRAGVNDGLVVLFDMDTTNRHGQIYLATGEGFRDLYLSDGEAQSVVDGDMLPKAKDGDLDGALIGGLEHLDRVVQPGGNPERAFLVALRYGGAILALVIGLAVVGLFVRAWWRQGRDAEIPLIDDSVLLPEPPRGLTPALATVLQHDLVTKDAFTSALVDLGHRGIVTFKEADGDSKKVDLVVPDEPLGDPSSRTARARPLGVAEHALASYIDGSAGADGVLDHEALKSGTGEKLWDDFKKHIGIAAKSSGWFRDDPNKLVGRWVGVGVSLAIAAGIVVFITGSVDILGSADAVPDGAPALLAALVFDVIAGIAIAFLSRYMAARTESGALTLAMALAYRNTLRYEIANAKTVDAAVEATKRRLPWITTPDVLTVWAVALGLNQEIDKLIRETLEADRDAGRSGWSPIWFSGTSWSSGGGVFGGGAGLAGAVASVSVSATSSSGGGFGGGGGGGGGGAGGGF